MHSTKLLDYKKFYVFIEIALILAGGHGANGSMGHGSQSDGESNNSTVSFLSLSIC